MPSILFVCVANSFRSQMAEAAAKALDEGKWEVWSAGSHPSGRVHPLAMELMREAGYDLSAHRSKGLNEVPAREWDVVVTMGCGDACPAVRARRRVDWDLPDPAALPPPEARAVRDRIIELVRGVMGFAPRS